MTDTSIVHTFEIGIADEVLDRVLTFTDESFGAGINNITITTESGSLIDGVVNIFIMVNGGGVILKFDGTNWHGQP